MISWNDFQYKNDGKETKAFEQMSYFLFCNELKIKNGIFRYKNQIGIETDPVEKNGKYFKKNGKYYGFQSKYYTKSIKDNKDKIIASIKKAKENNCKLNVMYIYINLEFSESKKTGEKEPEYKIEIESIAKDKGLEIEWRVPSYLEYQLSLPKNRYIYDIFFNTRIDIFKFKKEKNHIERINKKIYLKKLKEDNILLLTGISYCGKTYIANELAQYFQDDELYQIRKTSKIEEVMNFFSNEDGRKKILFLEDPFGNIEVEDSRENILKKIRDIIREINENQKIIITSRSDILLEIMNKNEIEECDIDKYKWNDLTEKNSDEVKKLWELYYGDSLESINVYKNISNELNKTMNSFQFGHIKNINCKIDTLENLKNKKLEEIMEIALIDSESIKNIIEKRGELSRVFFITLGLSCNTYKPISLIKLKKILNNDKIENYSEKLSLFLNETENNDVDWDDKYNKEFEYLEKRGLIKIYDEEITFSHPIYHYASYLLLKKLYLKTEKNKILKILEKNLYFPFVDVNICTLDFVEKLYKKTFCDDLKLLMLGGLKDIFPSVKEKIETFFSNNLDKMSVEEQAYFVKKSLKSKQIKWNKTEAYYDVLEQKEKTRDFFEWNIPINIDNMSLDNIDNYLLYKEENFIRNELIYTVFNKYAWELNNIDKYLKDYEHPRYIYSLFSGFINKWEKYTLEFKEKIINYLLKHLENVILLIQINSFLSNFFARLYVKEYTEKEKEELWKLWHRIWKVYFNNFPINYLTLPLFEKYKNSSQIAREFNLVENSISSLKFIKEEKEIIEFSQKWLIWAEKFKFLDEEICYEEMEEMKDSFLKKWIYEFGIVCYLLRGINKENKSRIKLLQKIISTKKTILSTINLFICVNYWDELSENEKRLILELLKSDRKDIKWLKAISLNVNKTPKEIQNEILGKVINEKDLVEFVNSLIEKDILEECLNIYCGYSQPLWWAGYYHQNSKLWNNVILEVLKRNELNKSYEIALREFVDLRFNREEYNLKIDRLLETIFDKRSKLFFSEILIFIVYKKFENIEALYNSCIILNKFLKYIRNNCKKKYKEYLCKLIEYEIIDRIEEYFDAKKIFDKKIMKDIKIKTVFIKILRKHRNNSIQIKFMKLKNWNN